MIELYTTASANGYRAAIMLEETGSEYTVHPVDLKTGAHRTPAFLKINPIGLIPVIIDKEAAGGPISIAETLAIALYLCERSGQLMPPTIAGRALAWQWAATGVSGFGPALFGTFLARHYDAQGHAPLIERYMQTVTNNFVAMNAALAERPYIAGDTFSFADVLLIPFALISAPQFALDFTELPHLSRWRDLVAMRPAVQRGLLVPASNP